MAAAQRVGPYLLGKTLGVGSTGRVKLGTHVDTSHNVAVKIVSKEFLASKASLQKKIEREITLMKLIRHPNVLSLHDVYESDKELFLILEYVEGGELFDYLVKRGRLPEREALIFFQQIINGLDFCHQHLVCHRDLKPENLLLDGSLNVKIADFGMATLQPEGKYLETSCGSPHYASPEIIRGEKYDGPAADIWSCGVILYALLTGNLPFDDENIRKLLGKVKAGQYFLPSSLSELSRDLIKRMLVVDPAQRITMQQIKTHPWFTSNANTKANSEPLPPVFISLPRTLNELDMEVVSNLRTLGYDDENDLIKNILSPDKTMEQVFYLLLLDRKKEYFDNGDANDEAWDDPQGPRRRSSSASGHAVERKASRGTLISPQSSSAELPLSPVGTPPSADTKYISSPLSGSSSSNTVPTTNSGVSLTSPPLSPVAENDLAGNGRNSPDATRRAASPGSIRSRAASDGGRSLLTAAVSPKAKRKPGAIDIPPADPNAAPPMGSPRFHRHRISESDASSPVVGTTSTPKKSWFATLFNFKGAVVTAHSLASIAETADAVQNAFKANDVVFTKTRDSSFKGRVDVAGKTARLRVDIAHGDSDSLDVVFIQERGSTHAFHAAVSAICKHANLDATNSTGTAV